MDKKSEGRKSRASSKSPGRPKKGGRAQSKSPGRPKSKSPGRNKKISNSPGRRPKSPGPVNRSKSPGPVKRPKSPGPVKRPKSPGPVKRKASPGRKVSPGRRTSPGRKTPENNSILKKDEIRSSLFVQLERTSTSPRKISPVELAENEGFIGDIEVCFVDDNVKYTTSSDNIKFLGNLNVGDVRQVKWEDGNYYDARILNLKNVSRDRSVSVPKASTSQVTRVYSEETTYLRRSARSKRDDDLDKMKNAMDAETSKILKANNTPLPPQYDRKYGAKSVREFGGWGGALVSIVLLPVVALALQMFCTKNKCVGVTYPSTNWRIYLDLHTAGYYTAFILWQALLNALPLGRKASYGNVQARLSGFYNALLTLVVLGGLYYYGYNVTAVLGKSVALLSSAVITALLLSLALFVKGSRAKTGRNIHADGNKIYDFFVGREIQPTLGPINLKAFFTRMEFVGILLLDAFYLLKYIETHAAGKHSPTLLFVVIAHTLYVIDTLWFEEKFMTSFQAQYEGVGYMNIMAAAIWPFLITLITRYIVYTGYESPTYRLIICGILFIAGYFVYRASNSQKAEYRKQPNHPVFSKYDTVSTVQGKRLLAGGWWGLLRHPNYAGDMVMVWAVAAVVGLSHWLPYVFPLLHAAVLIHRTFRVSARCKTVYGLAWDRYTQVVKYRLVPRVF